METIIRSPSVAQETRQLKRAQRPVQPASMSMELPAASNAGFAPALMVSPVVVVPVNPPAAVEPVVAPVPDVPQVPAISVEEIQRQHEEELTKLRALAEQRGYEEGLKKGEEAVQAALAEQVERLSSIVASLRNAKAELLDRAEDDMVEIVYTAVVRIVGETTAAGTAVAGMVKRALSEIRERDRLTVRVHPHDFALLQQISSLESAAANSQVSYRADASIELGGCIVESAGGNLDARLEVQLGHLRDALLRVRKSRQADKEVV